MSARLRRIVEVYKRDYRAPARAEMRAYRSEANLAEAVRRAALSELPDGKRHPHQCRIPGASLQEAARRLTGLLPTIARVGTFDELHELILNATRGIDRIGELAVYDMAHRIGAKRCLRPTLVYLHQGTRDGARALGFSGALRTLRKADLPSEFHTLSPAEIEDCLCIFKDQLRGLPLLGPYEGRHCRRATSVRVC